MFEKSTGKMVGLIGQHCMNENVPSWEFSCSLFIDFLKRGYATEATKAMIELAFELLQAKRVVIALDDQNEPTQKIAERLGFSYEATLSQQQWNWDHSRVFDLAFYSLLLPEYEANQDFYKVLR
jgi:ribosomal-protein-alanine N-acetyltransferase